jgi:hypothetical protein
VAAGRVRLEHGRLPRPYGTTSEPDKQGQSESCRRDALEGRRQIIMSPVISRLLEAMRQDDLIAFVGTVQDCPDLDERLDEGESALFHAIIGGRSEFVKVMLSNGADPNFRANGEAEFLWAPTPLDLAQQARFLMNWEKYHPIAVLLQDHGARDCDGEIDGPEYLDEMESQARVRQARRGQ